MLIRGRTLLLQYCGISKGLRLYYCWHCKPCLPAVLESSNILYTLHFHLATGIKLVGGGGSRWKRVNMDVSLECQRCFSRGSDVWRYWVQAGFNEADSVLNVIGARASKGVSVKPVDHLTDRIARQLFSPSSCKPHNITRLFLI